MDVVVDDDLVKKEMRGEVSDQEMEFLERNPIAWAAALSAITREMDLQLTMRKEKSMADGSDEAYQDYVAWKPTALAFKHHVVNRLREVKSKAEQAKLNVAIKHGDPVLDAILNEVTKIRELLELRN